MLPKLNFGPLRTDPDKHQFGPVRTFMASILVILSKIFKFRFSMHEFAPLIITNIIFVEIFNCTKKKFSNKNRPNFLNRLLQAVAILEVE